MSDRELRRLQQAVQAGDLGARSRLLRLLARVEDPQLVAAAALRRTLRRWLFQAQVSADLASRVIRFASLAEVLREGLTVELTPTATFAFRRLVGDAYDGVAMFCCCLDGRRARIGLREGGGGKTLASYWPDQVASWAGKAATREGKLRGLEDAPNVVDIDRAEVEDLLRFESWSQPNHYDVWLGLSPEPDSPEERAPGEEGPSKNARRKLAELQRVHSLNDEQVRPVLWELTGKFELAHVARAQFNASVKELERLATSAGAGEEALRVQTAAADERRLLLGEPALAKAVEALTTQGGGRLAMLCEALAAGAFEDERLLPLAVLGLSDPIRDFGDLLVDRVLPAYGAAAGPLLLEGFDPQGDRSHRLRLRALLAVDPIEGRALARRILEGQDASEPVALAAVEALAEEPPSLPLILRATRESSHAKVREAARQIVGAKAPQDDRASFVRQAMRTKDIGQAAALAKNDAGGQLRAVLMEEAYLQLELFTGRHKAPELKKTRSRGAAHFIALLQCVWTVNQAQSQEFFLACWEYRARLRKLSKTKGDELIAALATRLAWAGGVSAVDALLRGQDMLPADAMPATFAAAARVHSPATLYDLFACYLREGLGTEDRAAMHIEGLISGREAPDPLDPRWLELAVTKRHARLTRALVRPNHQGAIRFLTEVAMSDLDLPLDLPTAPSDRPPQVNAIFGLVAAKASNLEEVVVAVTRKVIKGQVPFFWLSSFYELPGRLAPALQALLPESGNDQELEEICRSLSKRRE